MAIESNEKTWFSSLPDLVTVDQAIFISGNAVKYCFKTLAEHKLTWPSSIEVIAVGQATAQNLMNHGIRVNSVPSHATSEDLLTLAAMQKIKGKIVLLVKGEGGRTLISETLQARGAHLISLAVYRRVMPAHEQQDLHSIWQDNAVDIILFTSQQAMNNIFTLLGKNAHTWLCNKPCLVISERLAKLASLLGIHTVIISRPETILTTLHQFNQGLIHGQ